MAYQFALPVDVRTHQNQLSMRISSINTRGDSQRMLSNRSFISMLQIPMQKGVRLEAPELPESIDLPDLQKLADNQIKGNAFTPAPPVIRNQSEKANARMAKKFSNRFQYIWVMVTQTNHPANKAFSDILYLDQKLDNVNHNLENLLAPEDYERVNIFPKQGLTIKLMFDYYSYSKYIKKELYLFAADAKILEIYAQKDLNSGQGIPTSNKIKNVEDLEAFIINEVKLDVEKCRKDKPYFNFIHSNSAPELFSRRSIIKSCLSSKTKEEFIKNNLDFIAMMTKFNKEQKLKRDKEASKQTINTIQLLEKSRIKYEKWQQVIERFEKNFTQLLQNNYPIEKQDDYQKKEVLNWIIIQYCIESPVYPVLNNTIRFSTNNQSVRPISTFIKYLYDALRFYFTTRYRQITYNVVYRGARVSLVEQSSFIEGRHLWNLGFMSTSRSKKVAEQFMRRGQNSPQANKKQFILIVIQLSSLVNELDHLWNQQGFFSLDKIPQIRKYIIAQEEQVLFNPLNVFKIIRWDEAHKVLHLQYAPQLEILENKKNRKKITSEEEEFLINIAKLKDVDFDKGQQHLQQGDPGSAVKYYELSDQTGSTLSFSQKSNYIKGLRQIGSAEKMETILKNSLEEQKSAQKQLEASTAASSTYDMLQNSIQTLTLFEQTTDYIGADEKVQQLSLQSSRKSIQTPTQQALLLQAKVYIKRASAKFGIGETFDSIKQSIRSLKIIDELAHVNFCYRLWQLGNEFKAMDRVRLSNELPNLTYLYNDTKFLTLDVQKQKEKLLKKISLIRDWDIKQTQIQITTEAQKSQVKKIHKKAEKLLNQYFAHRDKRTDIQKFQQLFIKAYWQTDLIKINREGISQKQQIEIREKLKVSQQQMFEVKNDYKQLFQHEMAAYEVLYRNIYKTSIDVSSCLESYHKNFFTRLEEFTNIEVQFEKQSIDSAEVYWKHAEILYEYGQIVQRPRTPNLGGKTQAQKLADVKMQRTQQIIRKLQSSQNRIKKTDAAYTYQKSELNRTLSRYFRSKTLEREKSRKLSVISDRSFKESTNSSTQASQKSEYFKSLVNILLENDQLCESDASINKSLYKVKNTCDLIESMNQSSTIVESNRTYLERLKSCKKYFHDVVATINKYKEKEIMERNINMAHLYLLMGQNQFRLGLISPARVYLNQANICLRKAMKIDDEKYKENIKVNKEKLLLGNNTHIGCLKLQAHIVAYFGDKEEKQKTLQTLLRKKQIMFATMSQPLSEAEMNQSIGLMMTNMLVLHKQLGFTFKNAKKPYVDAIKIRDILLGPYNRFNAINYTQIVNLVAQNQVRTKYYDQLTQFYKKAENIYDRIDLSKDSTLIMYKMQLKSTFLIFSNKNTEACQQILHDLKQFNSCPNKKMTLQSAREFYRCSKFLLEQQKYQRQGVMWLKSTYKYVLGLEQFINKTYPMQDTDLRKINILKLKNDVLTTIVKSEYRIFNKEVDEKYYNQYLEVKAKYEKALKEKNKQA